VRNTLTIHTGEHRVKISAYSDKNGRRSILKTRTDRTTEWQTHRQTRRLTIRVAIAERSRTNSGCAMTGRRSSRRLCNTLIPVRPTAHDSDHDVMATYQTVRWCLSLWGCAPWWYQLKWRRHSADSWEIKVVRPVGPDMPHQRRYFNPPGKSPTWFTCCENLTCSARYFILFYFIFIFILFLWFNWLLRLLLRLFFVVFLCFYFHLSVFSVSHVLRVRFFARDSVCCKRAYAIAIPSVCLSVCLSVRNTGGSVNKKTVLSQGNRAMPQLYFSV